MIGMGSSEGLPHDVHDSKRVATIIITISKAIITTTITISKAITTITISKASPASYAPVPMMIKATMDKLHFRDAHEHMTHEHMTQFNARVVGGFTARNYRKVICQPACL